MYLKFYLGDAKPSAATALVKQVMNVFLPGEFPSVSKGITIADAFIARGTPLLSDPEGGLRNVGIEFVDFGAPLAFYPPPLSLVDKGGSDLWEFAASATDAEMNTFLNLEQWPLGSARAVFRKCESHLYSAIDHCT